LDGCEEKVEYIDCSVFGVLEKENQGDCSYTFVIADIDKSEADVFSYMKITPNSYIVEKIDEAHVFPKLLAINEKREDDFLLQQGIKIVDVRISTDKGLELSKTVVDHEGNDLEKDISEMYLNAEIINISNFY
jgi:hypothetical protein